MSFRLRVLGLVMLVAVTATGATAWLTLHQASQQITESATADRLMVEQMVDVFGDYGATHGTWEGVPDAVLAQQRLTGQRIQLATEDGEVVVDTDTMAGRLARPVSTPVTVIDPRPVLDLDDVEVPELLKFFLTELLSYRQGVYLASCLTRFGLSTLSAAGDHGVPRFEANATDRITNPDEVRYCEQRGEAAQGTDAAEAAGQECQLMDGSDPTIWSGQADDPAALRFMTPQPRGGDEELARTCYQRLFAQQIAAFAPVPLLLYLGVETEPGTPLSTGPVLVAAGLVALFAIIGTILLSRRVLRPIGTLTAASRRLGAGDLGERVPVAGHDELAELARSFNRMADSLQRGEERQRRLVADVAHELRTPLANLRGYLEALTDGVIAPDVEVFASLHEEAVLQQRIVDDLQELALAEAGALAYHRSRVDLGELLEACRTAHLAVAEATGVHLLVDVPQATPVHADPDRLRQVIGNLLTNAIRATGAVPTAPDPGAVPATPLPGDLAGTGDGDGSQAGPACPTGSARASTYPPHCADGQALDSTGALWSSVGLDTPAGSDRLRRAGILPPAGARRAPGVPEGAVGTGPTHRPGRAETEPTHQPGEEETEPGGGGRPRARGTITLRALRPSPRTVVVQVEDTGTGIPVEQLPRLFDRFWRADAARGRSTGGSGLGLAIARQIITDHRGTIDVTSKVGVGTTFTITLPASE